MNKKKPPTAEQEKECNALKQIYESKKSQLGLTQDILGERLGISQGAVGHYLGGRNALNLEIALDFARHLKCKIEDFSPALAAKLQGISDSEMVQRLVAEAADLEVHEIQELIEAAKAKKKFRPVES